MSTEVVEVVLDGIVFTVTGDYYRGIPGRYSGPMEDCYPDELSEFDVTSVVGFVNGVQVRAATEQDDQDDTPEHIIDAKDFELYENEACKMAHDYLDKNS